MSASKATTTTTTTTATITKKLPPPLSAAPLSSSSRPQVFVEIPLSSFLSSRSRTTHSTRARSASTVKENAPLAVQRTNMTTTISHLSKKRKSSDEESSVSEDQTISSSKKAKLSASAPQTTAKSKTATKPKTKELVEMKQAVGIEEVEEFPNGHFYCHQCCRKRDASGECGMTTCRVYRRFSALIDFQSVYSVRGYASTQGPRHNPTDVGPGTAKLV
jgi:hypothetical protein